LSVERALFSPKSFRALEALDHPDYASDAPDPAAIQALNGSLLAMARAACAADVFALPARLESRDGGGVRIKGSSDGGAGWRDEEGGRSRGQSGAGGGPRVSKALRPACVALTKQADSGGRFVAAALEVQRALWTQVQGAG
jgi:hypothetical protein